MYEWGLFVIDLANEQCCDIPSESFRDLYRATLSEKHAQVLDRAIAEGGPWQGESLSDENVGFKDFWLVQTLALACPEDNTVSILCPVEDKDTSPKQPPR